MKFLIHQNIIIMYLFLGWYVTLASEQQKQCTKDILRSLPTVVEGGVMRFSRSLTTGLFIGVDYKWSLMGLEEASEEYQEVMSEVHTRSAKRILTTCLTNGGLYIKFGQGMCTHGVLPPEYSKVMVVLQDQALRRDCEDEVDQLFVDELGKSKEELFSDFNEEPIAAASLAQVFKATTKEGEKVAVKVQYRDLQDKFVSDVATMETVLDIIQIIHPKFAFKWVFQELQGRFKNELDFEAEAGNSRRCAEELKHLPYLYVPKVIESHSSKRILTTEFIDGIKVSDQNSLEAEGLSVKEIDRKILRIFSEQLFHTGFVHADPHPGNILIQPTKKKGESRIVLLDHGLYEEMTNGIREALAGLWVGIVNLDHSEMEKWGNSLNVEDYRVFAMALSQRFIAPVPGSDDEVDVFTQLLGKKGFNRKMFNALPEEEKKEIRAAIMKFHDRMFDTFQKMPPKMVLVMRNLNTIRSIITLHKSNVDRFRLMARVAVSGKFSGGVRGVLARFVFELRLAWDFLKVTAMTVGFSVASKLGLTIVDMTEEK